MISKLTDKRMNIVADLTLTSCHGIVSHLLFASWIRFPKKHNFQKNHQEILKLNFDLIQAKSIASYWTYHRWLLYNWSFQFARDDLWKVAFLKFSSIRFFKYFLQYLCRYSFNISCFTSRCQYSSSTWLPYYTEITSQVFNGLKMYAIRN